MDKFWGWVTSPVSLLPILGVFVLFQGATKFFEGGAVRECHVEYEESPRCALEDSRCYKIVGTKDWPHSSVDMGRFHSFGEAVFSIEFLSCYTGERRSMKNEQ